MKRTILVVLLAVMVATPCLAQEVEPDGIFSLHETKWGTLAGITILPFPFLLLLPPYVSDLTYGFYDKEVYPYLESASESFYVDMIVASIFVYKRVHTDRAFHFTSTEIGFGIMQPIGIGLMTVYGDRPFPLLLTILLIKTDNNWTPPEEE